jgi:hypothetical protein
MGSSKTLPYAMPGAGENPVFRIILCFASVDSYGWINPGPAKDREAQNHLFLLTDNS